jgi:branched-chain amino acid transport system ATP-binding protein
LFNGADITAMRPWHRCRLGIGRTYQTPKPFSHMSVFENVLAAAVHGGRMSTARGGAEAVSVLQRTGLLDRAPLPARQLALLDMKQLELAKALALRPRLLLLDEIAGGLTEAECGELVELMRAIKDAGITIVWVEHVVHALLAVVSRLAVLNFGRKIIEGEPRAVMASAEVREIYMGIAA